MTSSPPKKRSKKKLVRKAATPALSDSDLEALSKFCDSVQVDEVSMEEWESCHSDLDVTVPLFVTPAEASAGGERQLSFSRVTTKSGASVRARASCLVSVPASSKDGDTLVIPSEGDTRDALQGNLRVIIRFKSPS